jgi:hypothetical protein
MLVYGASGSGKTYLAMQAALVEGMSPAILISCDYGAATARRIDIDVLQLSVADDLLVLLREIRDKKVEYNTIIIDGFAHLYDAVLNKQSEGRLPDIRDWRVAFNESRKMLRAATKLGKQLIVTCLAQQVTDAVSGVVTTMPLVPGKLAFNISEWFDITGYVRTTIKGRGVEGVHRILQVQPRGATIAKDRDGTLGVAELDITWKLNDPKPPMEYIWKRWKEFGAGTIPVAPEAFEEIKLAGEKEGGDDNLLAGEEVVDKEDEI